MGKMKANVFVEKAVEIAKNFKTLYVMGCFGAPLPGDYPEERLFGDRARVGRPHDLPGAHGLRHWGAVRHDRGGDEGGD